MEKMTCLIEYASKEFLPLIMICASLLMKGTHASSKDRLNLMQMAYKMSSALFDISGSSSSYSFSFTYLGCYRCGT